MELVTEKKPESVIALEGTRIGFSVVTPLNLLADKRNKESR